MDRSKNESLTASGSGTPARRHPGEKSAGMVFARFLPGLKFFVHFGCDKLQKVWYHVIQNTKHIIQEDLV